MLPTVFLPFMMEVVRVVMDEEKKIYVQHKSGDTMPLIDECERRLRHGIPLRLDQQVGLLEQGYDVGAIEEQINDDMEEVD